MILSKLDIDMSKYPARRSLANCCELHRDIMSAFPQTESVPVRFEMSVLYRVVEQPRSACIYVLSDEEPKWSVLENRGYTCLRCEPVDRVLDRFSEGKVLWFELLTMPFKKVRVETKNSRRVFLRGEAEQLEWLRRRAQQKGFEILNAVCSGEKRISGKKGESTFVYNAVKFQGALKIVNPIKFNEAYKHGIGAGKAYGMGMLLVKGV